MPFRSTILHPETLQSIVLAADERYYDAAELLAKGRTTGAVHVAGFAAEMLLKHAAFRLRGAKPGDPIGPLFGPMKRWAKTFLPLIDSEDYHSRWFWTKFIRWKRRELGRPLPEEFDRHLVRRMRRLHISWCVDLRYCELQASGLEAKESFDDVAWLRKHNTSLWR